MAKVVDRRLAASAASGVDERHDEAAIPSIDLIDATQDKLVCGLAEDVTALASVKSFPTEGAGR